MSLARIDRQRLGGYFRVDVSGESPRSTLSSPPVVERDRVCLTHGRVLSVTDQYELRCPEGGHTVTRWGIGDPRKGSIDDAAAADDIATSEVPAAALAARKESSMRTAGNANHGSPALVSVADRVRSAPAAPEERGAKWPNTLVSQIYKDGPARLKVSLRFYTKWAKPYRVGILHHDGKKSETGVLAQAFTEKEGRDAFDAQCKIAEREGWVETAGRGAGGLTAIPTAKGKKR